MDTRSEIREFLISRRARITPEQAGLPAYGSNRRVAGLRRGEVALLSGISVEYYTRLERGNVTGVSDSVLDGLARALQLDEAERTHLFHLVRTTSTGAPARRRPAHERVRPSVQRILDAITDTPAFVRNARLDVLAANSLGAGLLLRAVRRPGPAGQLGALPLPQLPRHRVLRGLGHHRQRRRRHPSCRGRPRPLRPAAVRPHRRALHTKYEFRVRWATYNVKLHRTGVKRFRHPLVGELTLDFESLELPGDPGQSMLVYTAEPASPTRERLDLLASWSSTPRHWPPTRFLNTPERSRAPTTLGEARHLHR